MNDDLLVDDFEIKAPIQSAKTVEGLAVTLDFTEALIIEMLEIVFGDLEFIEEFQLLESTQLGNLIRPWLYWLLIFTAILRLSLK